MIHIDLLRKFLAPAGQPLSQPMIFEDQLVFADGCILVAVPQDGHSLVDAIPSPFKNLGEFQQRTTEATPYFPLQVELPDAMPCNACGGTGKELVCSICKGEGCDRCEGDGVPSGDDQGTEQPCYNCDGSGQAPHQIITVGNTTLARRFVALMLKLPGIEYHTPTRKPHEYPMVSFRFDGGWGCVMPCVDRP